MKLIAPSMLASDFGKLEEEILMVNNSKADWFHIDVMDGVFVPNISFGTPILNVLKKCAKKPLDVHLMITKPERYIDKFIELGSNILTVHVEATNKLNKIIDKTHQSNIKSGIAINPDTPISRIEDYINDVDLICLMGVHAGFGGQKFIEKTYSRLEKLKNLINSRNSSAIIEIDGGVNETNFEMLKSLGADVLVAGSFIFKSTDYNKAIDLLK